MSKLLEILARFKSAHILTVGDLMLDRFVMGEVERLSPEAPVPVLRVVSEELRLGGAANVIHNIRSLGARVTACGVIGKDDAGNAFLMSCAASALQPREYSPTRSFKRFRRVE